MNIIDIKNIDIVEIQWEETIPVRHQVLWPDKDKKFCHVKGDLDALHFGAFFNNEIICVASIYIKEREARLRKFATIPKYQKYGIGTKVLDFILDTLKEMDITYFWCDARKTAVNFYKRFGFEIEGLEFIKSDKSYFKMATYL